MKYSVLVLIALLFSTGQTETVKTVHVGMYQNAPKIFTDSAGNPAGIFPEILAAVSKAKGWSLVYHEGSWDQCLAMLQDGVIDIMPDMAYSAKRDSIFDFSAEEVLTSWSAVYAAPGRKIKTFADLKGLRIAVVKGSIQETYLTKMLTGLGSSPRFAETSAFADAYLSVQKGRADAVAANHFSGDYWSHRYGLEKTAVVFNPASLYFASAGGKNRDLLADIDSEIRKQKESPNSAFYTALNRWSFHSEKESLLPLVIGLLTVTAALLAVSVLFIVILRWRVKRGISRIAESEKQLQGISSNIEEGFFYSIDVGENGEIRRFQYISAGVEKMFGMTASSLYSDASAIYAKIHPDDVNDLFSRQSEVLQEFLTKGTGRFSAEVRYTRGGEERWLQISSTPHREKDNHLIWVGICIDTTERHSAVDALIESERYSRTLFNQSPIGLALCKMDGTLIDVNRAYCSIVGYSAHELKNLTYWELTPPEYAEQEAVQLKSMELTGKYGPYEKEYIHKEGRRVPVLLKGLVVERNSERCIWSSVEDITYRKQAEEEQSKLRDQLHHSQKMEALGKLVGGIAHDFNNTLGAIIGAAELIEAGFIDQDEVKEYAHMIASASKRSGELTRKLLTYTRQMPHRRIPLNIVQTAADTVVILERTCPKNIQITLNTEAESIIILGDESMIQNALVNMGINASHAMPNGGTLTLSLSLTSLDERRCEQSLFTIKPGEYVQLSVKDTGEGIGKDDIAHIFDPFFTTKAQGEGTGLGLSLVYGTVLDLEGEITVESQPGRGTEFSILIPISHDEEVFVSEEMPHGSGTILVVDDEANILKVVGKHLESLGYTPILVQNGYDAVRELSYGERSPDLVILDMRMPEISGAETLRRIREISSVPVIAASGYTSSEDRAELERYGAAEFLHKPFKKAELASAVGRYCRVKEKQ